MVRSSHGSKINLKIEFSFKGYILSQFQHGLSQDFQVY